MSETHDSSPMCSLSYRMYSAELRSYFWRTGEQVRESIVRREANRLAESGALAVHWETM